MITEILASITHRKPEIETFLAHQVANSVIAEQTGEEGEHAASLRQSYRAGCMTISGREVRRCDQRKGQLNSEENTDVHCVQRKASDEEK